MKNLIPKAFFEGELYLLIGEQTAYGMQHPNGILWVRSSYSINDCIDVLVGPANPPASVIKSERNLWRGATYRMVPHDACVTLSVVEQVVDLMHRNNFRFITDNEWEYPMLEHIMKTCGQL